MQIEQDRFIRKVSYDPQTHCWEWIGAHYRGGYGHFRRKIDDKWVMYKAHRYSFEFYNKTTASGLCVLHRCDNPNCVNPDHLFVGTTQENHKDMMNKNRWKLIRNPRHNLLTQEIADNIRKFSTENPDISGVELSKLFGTSPAQISRILSNKIWQEEN